MSAPTYSNQLPTPDDTSADLDVVSILWTPGPVDNSDPIDLTSLVIKRGATAYPTSYLAMPGFAFKAFAEVGLYPEETAITVTAEAESIGGAPASVSWSFDCRGGFRDVSRAEITKISPLSVRMVAELRRINPLGSPAILGNLSSRPAIAGFAQLAELRPVVFTGSADLGVAHISATRQILQLLAIRSAGIALPSEGRAATSSEVHDSYVTVAHGWASTGANGEGINPALRSVADAVPEIWTALRSLGVSRERIEEALRALEIRGGEGAEIMIDLLDAILDEAR